MSNDEPQIQLLELCEWIENKENYWTVGSRSRNVVVKWVQFKFLLQLKFKIVGVSRITKLWDSMHVCVVRFSVLDGIHLRKKFAFYVIFNYCQQRCN